MEYGSQSPPESVTKNGISSRQKTRLDSIEKNLVTSSDHENNYSFSDAEEALSEGAKNFSKNSGKIFILLSFVFNLLLLIVYYFIVLMSAH